MKIKLFMRCDTPMSSLDLDHLEREVNEFTHDKDVEGVGTTCALSNVKDGDDEALARMVVVSVTYTDRERP